MNTATTRTDAGQNDARTLSTRGTVKKSERRKDIVYKDDLVDVWTTANHPSKKAGKHKRLHKMHAANLEGKGLVSYVNPNEGGEELAEGGEGKPARRKKGE
jgi:hypothetical protein